MNINEVKHKCAGLEKIPIPQGLVICYTCAELYQLHNRWYCQKLCARHWYCPSEHQYHRAECSIATLIADVATSSTDITSNCECFMIFHNVLWVLHNDLLVVHNILHVFHDVLEVFYDVLWCLASRAMIGITTCTISNAASETAQLPITEWISANATGIGDNIAKVIQC